MISEIKNKELLKLYVSQRDKFQKSIEKHKDPESWDGGYYMTRGNKGMADTIIKDLKRLLEEEEET